jgi:hypothetical protein
VAVLGFAAGRGGNPDYRPGVPCAIVPVAKLLDALGKQIKVPVTIVDMPWMVTVWPGCTELKVNAGVVSI